MNGTFTSRTISITSDYNSSGPPGTREHWKLNNKNVYRPDYVVDFDKWSSPPSYETILELDSRGQGDITDHNHIQVEIQTDGLPSYHEACTINNINNNYI